MAENEQLPAWLADLRDQQLGEQLQEQPPLAQDPQEQMPEQVQEQMGQASLREDVQTRAIQAEEQAVQQEEAPPADMLDDLREQMMMAEDELVYEEKTSFVQPLLSLKPPQRLLLAILLFLNVAVCGCMALVMMGRVVPPF